MDGDQIFRIAFWVLFGLLLLIRILSILMVRLAGEWFMPDRKAVEREGRWMFTAQVVTFFVLIIMLVLYALNSP